MALSPKDVQIIAEAVAAALKEAQRQSRTVLENPAPEVDPKDVSKEVREFIESAKSSNISIKDNFEKLTDALAEKISESLQVMEEDQEKLKRQQEQYFKKQEEFAKQKQDADAKERKLEEKIKQRTEKFNNDKMKGEFGNTPELQKQFEDEINGYRKVIEQNKNSFKLEQQARDKDNANRLKAYEEEAKATNLRFYKKIEDEQKRLRGELTFAIKGAGKAAFTEEIDNTKDVSKAIQKYKTTIINAYNELEANTEKRKQLGITDDKMYEQKEELYNSFLDELERQRDKKNLDKKTRVLLEEQYKREKIKAGITTYQETYGGGSSIAKFAGRMADFTTSRYKDETEKSSIFTKAFNAGLGSLFKGKEATANYLPLNKTQTITQDEILNPRAKQKEFVKGTFDVNKKQDEKTPEGNIEEGNLEENKNKLEVDKLEVNKLEESKPAAEPLADKLIKEEAVTTIIESPSLIVMKDIQQMLEQAKENVPFKVIISNIEGEGKKSLTEAFSDSLKEALQPLSDKLDKESKPKDDKNLLKGLKRILSRNKKDNGKDKSEKEGSGSKIPSRLITRGAAKAAELGMQGYRYMAGATGITGLLGTNIGTIAGGAFTGAGAGMAITAGGLAVGAGYLGYQAGKYLEDGGVDEDTGNKKGGAGSKFLEAAGENKKELQLEKIISEQQEKTAALNQDPSLTKEQKRLGRFKLDLERLEAQKELNKTYKTPLGSGGNSPQKNREYKKGEDENIAIDKQIAKLEKTIKILEDKEALKKYENKQTEEIPKQDQFLPNGQYTAPAPALAPAAEVPPAVVPPAVVPPAAAKPEKKLEKKSESLFPEDDVQDTKNAPTLTNKPEVVEDDRYSKKKQTVSENKNYEKYYNNLYELTGDQVPTDKASIDKLPAEMYKKQTEGHPYSEDNPEFKNDPELWKAVSKNKPTSVYNYETGGSGNSARLQLTSHPLHTSDAARMGSGMQQSGMEMANANRGLFLGRQALSGYSKASQNAVFGHKNMGAVVEALNGADVNKAKLLIQEDLKLAPRLSEFLPKELLSGGNSNILSKKAETDINKALSDLENTVTPGIGGTDVSNIRDLVGKGDYKTAIKAMEYISKVQGRENLPLDPETYKDLTGKVMTIKKPAASTINTEKADSSKKITPTVSKETSVVTPPKPPESSDNADLEPLLATNNLQTDQIITLLQDLIKVTAGKNYNPTPIIPINVTQAAPSQNVAQTQSPAYQFRSQNRLES